jgi:Uma2 family endonuclease
MFERYTERARRTIFFARYEASQFGCLYIETEHLLLGLFREDKVLASQFLGPFAKLEALRHSIEQRTKSALKISTSVDLPLSHESKRVLAYAAEESARMNHKHIGTPHLLLGLLREEKCLAAELLQEQGLSLEPVRERVLQSEPPLGQGVSASIGHLSRWLTEREADGGIWIVEQKSVGRRRTDFAIYAGDPPQESESDRNMAPAEKLAHVQRRIEFIIEKMERAIASHEFEKARSYSDEERKERENLRLLCEQFNLEEPPPRVPLLCIEILRDERFSDAQKRYNDYLDAGVAEIWILDPNTRRAYTVTKAEGLREFKGEILQIANPPLQMDLKRIFS